VAVVNALMRSSSVRMGYFEVPLCLHLGCCAAEVRAIAGVVLLSRAIFFLFGVSQPNICGPSVFGSGNLVGVG